MNAPDFNVTLTNSTSLPDLQAREAFIASANADILDIAKSAAAMLDQVNDHEASGTPRGSRRAGFGESYLGCERSRNSVEADRCSLALIWSKSGVLLLRREFHIYGRTIRREDDSAAGAEGRKFLVQHFCHFSKECIIDEPGREATKHGQNAAPEANLFGIKSEGVAHDPSFRNRIDDATSP
jgi:hypothetical protein